jgi:autotransporter-associated beta strand protein
MYFISPTIKILAQETQVYRKRKIKEVLYLCGVTLMVNSALISSSHAQVILNSDVSATNIIVSNNTLLTLNTGSSLTASHITVDGGTLLANGNSAVNGQITITSNNGTFNTATAKTLTVQGDIGGNGSLNKTGAGKLALGGNNTYAGNTQVSGGSLELNSSTIPHNLTLAPHTKLNGSGTINGNLNNNDAKIIPGDLLGVIRVNGDYNATPDSTLEIHIQSSATPVAGVDYSKLEIHGDADLNNSNLNIHSANGTYPEDHTYTFLTAGNIISNFDEFGMQTSLYLLEPIFEVNQTTATLRFHRPQLRKKVVQGNIKDSAIIKYLDTIPNSKLNTELASSMAQLLQLPSSTLETAVKSISPLRNNINNNVITQTNLLPPALISGRLESLRFQSTSSLSNNRASFSSIDLNEDLFKEKQLASFIANQDQEDDTLSNTFAGTIKESLKSSLLNDQKVWVSPFGMITRQSDNLHTSEYKAYTKGVIAGYDHTYDDGLILGFSGGYSKTSLKSEEGGGVKSKLSAIFTSAYSSKTIGDYYIDASMTYSYNGYKNKRHILYPSSDAQTNHHGHNLSYHFGGGYNYNLEDYTITPHAGIDYTDSHENAYTEYGAGAWNMHVNAKKTHLIRSEIGMKLLQEVELDNDTILAVKSNVSYVNKRASGVNNMVASLASYNSPFVVSGSDTTNNEFSPGLEFSIRDKNGLTVAVTYNGEFSRSYKAHQSLFNLAYKF